MDTLSKNLHHGSSMIEVLVTIVILTIGMLGLAGLQTRLQVAELEASQRAHAMLLLEDMANRIAANRNNAGDYITSAALGTGDTCTSTSASSRQIQDSCEWSEALKGAGETTGASTKVGAFIGGRGCISSPAANQYLVTVAWQGMVPIAAPPASVTCGEDQYNASGTSCSGDKCRRTLTTLVGIASL